MFVGYVSNNRMLDFSPQLLVLPVRSIHSRRYIIDFFCLRNSQAVLSCVPTFMDNLDPFLFQGS